MIYWNDEVKDRDQHVRHPDKEERILIVVIIVEENEQDCKWEEEWNDLNQRRRSIVSNNFGLKLLKSHGLLGELFSKPPASQP